MGYRYGERYYDISKDSRDYDDVVFRIRFSIVNLVRIIGSESFLEILLEEVL